MLIDNEYLLMIPGFVDGEDYLVVLYEVQSMLDLQQSDIMLAGHPSEDLPDLAWGTITYPAYRVKRWLDQDRLVKVKLNSGGSIRVTFSEPKEWQKYITPEQWQWLGSVCEVSQVFVEQQSRQENLQQIVQVEPEPPKPKKKRVKAKIRRKQSKRDLILEGDGD